MSSLAPMLGLPLHLAQQWSKTVAALPQCSKAKQTYENNSTQLAVLRSTFSAVAATAIASASWSRATRRSRRLKPRTIHLAEATTGTTTMVSPFAAGKETNEKQKLPLTWENVEKVLDEVRPYLRNDGGDCKIVDIDGPIVRLELQGSCSSCSSSAVTLKLGIEKTLMERIPEIAEIISVMPDQEPLTAQGVEEVLNGIRPFLSVSGGAIDIQELVEGDAPQIILQMSGPPLKSMAVRVEVVNRMKKKYPLVQEVIILGPDGKPATSA